MAQWKRPPTERELDGLIDSFILEENLERFQLPAQAIFSHIYFSVDRRGEACESDALDALHKMRDGASLDEHGDPFMLQRDYPSRTEQEVAELFGSAFGEALLS